MAARRRAMLRWLRMEIAAITTPRNAIAAVTIAARSAAFDIISIVLWSLSLCHSQRHFERSALNSSFGREADSEPGAAPGRYRGREIDQTRLDPARNASEEHLAEEHLVRRAPRLQGLFGSSAGRLLWIRFISM